MSHLDWPNPEPKHKHVELHDGEIKEKILIVGDVHGCLDELKDLLIKSAYNPDDTTLILVGDLVNKGPYSAETVSYVRQLGAYCVRGNHDESALTCALKIEHKSARNYEYAAQFTRYGR
jgi:predicted phosphodiesterase